MMRMESLPPIAEAPRPLAVLVSGGLDSAILLADSLANAAAVHPLYVRCGLAWERAELGHLRRFLEEIRAPALRPLRLLEMPVGDTYGSHWSLTADRVPAAGSTDDAVYLPGRNVLLLSKAMLWCHLHAVQAVAVATLRGNPFADATPAFFSEFESVVNLSVSGRVRLLQPYRDLSKAELLRRGHQLPLQWTFSCIRPSTEVRHCGACNKCAERQAAFRTAGLPDPTAYAGSHDV
jgi:7-cyano-7-deazaguanine synthase